MLQITGILATGSQTLTIADPNGNGPITMTLHYYPRTQEWYIDIDNGDFKINGFKLAACPNRFSQYINRLGFGLAVITKNKLDPMMINDFSSGAAALYLLTTDEVNNIADAIESGDITG